jgi:hypothetical protein
MSTSFLFNWVEYSLVLFGILLKRGVIWKILIKEFLNYWAEKEEF